VAGHVNNDYVFGRPDGTVLRSDTLGRRFRRAVRVAGLPTIRFHDLRHTSASLALAAGIPMRVISDLLGHSSTAITADLHTRVVPSVARGAAEAIAGLVAAASGPINDRHVGEMLASQRPTDSKEPKDVAKPQVTRGGPPGDRTQNPRIKSPLLCQLS
jgi:integrase-like protein